MSIVFGDNIEYKGKKPLDSRMLFDTIADMKAYSENYLPDITLAFNKEDGKMYVFNRENEVDTTTGKWREFEGDSAIAVEDLTNYNEDENRVAEQYMVMKRNITTQKWDKLPENSMQDKSGSYSFNSFDVAGKYWFNSCVVSDGHPAMLNLDGQGKVHGVLEVFESYVYNQTSTSTGGIVFQRFTTTNSGQQLQFSRRKAFGHSGNWGVWTMEQTNRQSVNRGKTYAFFGGSVCYNWNPLSGTAADNYAIEEILGVNSIRKRAISGAGWVAGNKIDNQITTELAEANPADVWVFWSSTNDHTAQVPIGDLDHKSDTTTVIGAMCNAIERVRTAQPTANILMTTPIRRFNNESGWNPYYDDGTTIPFYKYAEAVYTVANYYGIPVFDLWDNSGIDIKNYTTYMSDTIHPNANGYKLFQRELCKFCANGHNGNSMPTTKKTLVDLDDTNITSPTNGQVVKYDSTTQKWINADNTEYMAGDNITITDETVPDYSAMRGPCDEGFHIPGYQEFQDLISITDGLSLTTEADYKAKLHMPLAGGRDCEDSSIFGQDRSGRYWTHSIEPRDTDSAYYLWIDSIDVNVLLDPLSNGLSLRCFTDEYVEPDNTWTVVVGALGSAGIFYNATLGLISLTNGSDKNITMKDKNEGATVVYNDGDTLTQDNVGNYYQWGNNYGFPSVGTVSKSATKVDASSYAPSTYNSDTFITTDYEAWSEPKNDDLWGEVTGVQPKATGNKIISATDIDTTIQVSEMPAEAEEDKIVQYVGESTAEYTNGYFYKAGELVYDETVSTMPVADHLEPYNGKVIYVEDEQKTYAVSTTTAVYPCLGDDETPGIVTLGWVMDLVPGATIFEVDMTTTPDTPLDTPIGTVDSIGRLIGDTQRYNCTLNGESRELYAKNEEQRPTGTKYVATESSTYGWVRVDVQPHKAQESATTNYRGMTVEQALDEEYKPVENLITDDTKIIDGFWLKSGSTCSINTSIAEFQSFYIPVEEGKTYYTAAKMNSLWIAYLDENEEAVDALTVSGSAITIPTGQDIKYLSYPQRQAYKPITVITEKPAEFVGELDIYRMTSAGEEKMQYPSPRSNGNYYATDTAFTEGTTYWYADYTYNLKDSVISIGMGSHILGVNTQDNTAISLSLNSSRIYLFDIVNNSYVYGDSPVTIPEEWHADVAQHKTPSGLHGAVRVDDENNYILRAEGLSDFIIPKSAIKTRVESQNKVFEDYTTASGMLWQYGSGSYKNSGVFTARHRGPIVEKKSTEENNHWYGKSWYAYGTSMTDTSMNGYTVELQSLLGANLTNYGKGGSGIIPSLHGGTSGDNTYTRVKNITDGKTNADLITLEIIPNDMSGTLGTPTDNYSDGTTETFCGCLNELLQYLQVNTNAQIVVLIATRSRYNHQDPTEKYPPESQKATDWLAWTDAAKECCRRNCVPFIDGQSNCGLGYARVKDGTKYVRDQIHLTPLGAKNLGQYFYSQIKNIPLFYSE